ncbi:hypothetical protein CG51_16995 [Haematobacter missouriensis]|uniref:HTH luxR-type domain-containing protein n=1 Tax=Haematobacter missouriensis TaxID=366616 RepID=A0A212AYS4_9RHOB|nr:LuxR family transcriptional regulator [Haematobacter missouriensis]KFI25012.1 hypothetical protein CG51_16995 [Haematobacter missouriensis]OWJ75511.1 hypothetical protein CDV53_10385 [Haematobacter missouriensis]OWJ86618.1 hypothetical protein CDV52_01315 [Haematobacter missouriensis]
MTDFNKINLLLDSANFEDLWEIYTRILVAEGFDAILFGQARPASGLPLRTSPMGTMLISNLDKSFCHAYGGKNFFCSPIVKWVTSNSGVLLWSEIYRKRHRGELSPEEEKMLDLQRNYGIRGGITIALGETGSRRRAAIDLMTCRDTANQADVERIWGQRKDFLLLLTRIFYLKALTVPSIVTAILTKRQREVLEWAAAGKSVQDIAALLGISRATAEKHLRLAREMLGAETTAQAVAKALSSQLIQSGPPALLPNSCAYAEETPR